MLIAIFRSPALRAAFAFGFGGAAFTLGTLIFARALPAPQYALLSLVIGVIAVAGPTTPMGFDYVIARRGMTLDAGLRRSTMLTAALISVVTVVLCALLYRLQAALLLAIFVSTLAMGVTQCVGAHFQGQRQFAWSLPFTQISNAALLAVSIVAWFQGMTDAVLPSGLIAAASGLASVAGWLMIARRTAGAKSASTIPGLWSEAMSLMAINVTGTLLLQLERLVAPVTMGVESLALFGVAASLVGSPFRMLHSAVNFTVVPRLRAVGSPAGRRQLLLREALIFAVVILPVSAAIWFAVPAIAHWFLGGRYDLSGAIVAAMIVSGLLKVLSAFGTSAVSALAPDRGLWLLSAASWVCIALAVGLAFMLRPWGLCGVIYATSAGWLIRTLVAFWISLAYLRDE